MVKRAMVRAMSPTASNRLLRVRWSWAPLRHSQPEMAASGVMSRKQAMSHSSVRFSLRGPGSRNHWEDATKGPLLLQSFSRQLLWCLRTHAHTVPMLYLCEGLGSPFNSELCVAELTVTGVGGRQPLLQAALVHLTQGPCAVARGEQRLTTGPLVADTTHAFITG